LLSAPFTVAQDTPVDVAIRLAFIQCYANHWHGTKTQAVKGSDQSVQLQCGDFWKKFEQDYRYPGDADKQQSPFRLVGLSVQPVDIPFSTWSVALEELLKMSDRSPK
jgi:hypothetical protein